MVPNVQKQKTLEEIEGESFWDDRFLFGTREGVSEDQVRRMCMAFLMQKEKLYVQATLPSPQITAFFNLRQITIPKDVLDSVKLNLYKRLEAEQGALPASEPAVPSPEEGKEPAVPSSAGPSTSKRTVRGRGGRRISRKTSRQRPEEPATITDDDDGKSTAVDDSIARVVFKNGNLFKLKHTDIEQLRLEEDLPDFLVLFLLSIAQDDFASTFLPGRDNPIVVNPLTTAYALCAPPGDITPCVDGIWRGKTLEEYRSTVTGKTRKVFFNGIYKRLNVVKHFLYAVEVLERKRQHTDNNISNKILRSRVTFIPMVANYHWSMAVVLNMYRLQEIYNARASDEKGCATARTTILWVDSLSESDSPHLPAVKTLSLLLGFLFLRSHTDVLNVNATDVAENIDIVPMKGASQGEKQCGIYLGYHFSILSSLVSTIAESSLSNIRDAVRNRMAVFSPLMYRLRVLRYVLYVIHLSRTSKEGRTSENCPLWKDEATEDRIKDAKTQLTRHHSLVDLDSLSWIIDNYGSVETLLSLATTTTGRPVPPTTETPAIGRETSQIDPAPSVEDPPGNSSGPSSSASSRSSSTLSSPTKDSVPATAPSAPSAPVTTQQGASSSVLLKLRVSSARASISSKPTPVEPAPPTMTSDSAPAQNTTPIVPSEPAHA